MAMTTRSTEPSLSPLVPGLSRRGLLIAAASTAAGTAGLLILPTKAEAATASPRHGSRPDVVGPWFDEMLATFAAAPTAGLPERMWAMSWIAAWAALSARRAAPVRAPGQRAVFEDAATATAVHGVLKALVPGQADKLDGPRARPRRRASPPVGRPRRRWSRCVPVTASTWRR